MNYESLHELGGMRSNVALTLTLNTHPKPHPKNNQDAILVKNMVAAAKKRVLSEYSAREAEDVLNNLEKIEGQIDHRWNQNGLAIFVSESTLSIFHLPFRPGNKVKMGDKFHTRTLVRKFEQVDHYYILTISQSETRLFEAYDQTILKELEEDGFPFKNEGFAQYRDSEKRSYSGAMDKRVQAYYRDVNEQLKEHYRKEPMPIVLAGTVENIANYREVVSKNKLIIGEVQGNFDNHEGTDLRTLVDLASAVIAEYKEAHYMHALDTINEAKGAHLLESELSSIYNFAKLGQVKEFIVEEDFYFPGYLNDAGMLLNASVAEGTYIDDAVNEIIHYVYLYGGDVTFLPPFYLEDSNAHAILRWR